MSLLVADGRSKRERQDKQLKELVAKAVRAREWQEMLDKGMREQFE